MSSHDLVTGERIALELLSDLTSVAFRHPSLRDYVARAGNILRVALPGTTGAIVLKLPHEPILQAAWGTKNHSSSAQPSTLDAPLPNDESLELIFGDGSSEPWGFVSVSGLSEALRVVRVTERIAEQISLVIGHIAEADRLRRSLAQVRAVGLHDYETVGEDTPTTTRSVPIDSARHLRSVADSTDSS